MHINPPGIVGIGCGVVAETNKKHCIMQKDFKKQVNITILLS